MADDKVPKEIFCPRIPVFSQVAAGTCDTKQNADGNKATLEHTVRTSSMCDEGVGVATAPNESRVKKRKACARADNDDSSVEVLSGMESRGLLVESLRPDEPGRTPYSKVNFESLEKEHGDKKQSAWVPPSLQRVEGSPRTTLTATGPSPDHLPFLVKLSPRHVLVVELIRAFQHSDIVVFPPPSFLVWFLCRMLRPMKVEEAWKVMGRLDRDGLLVVQFRGRVGVYDEDMGDRDKYLLFRNNEEAQWLLLEAMKPRGPRSRRDKYQECLMFEYALNIAKGGRFDGWSTNSRELTKSKLVTAMRELHADRTNDSEPMHSNYPDFVKVVLETWEEAGLICFPQKEPMLDKLITHEKMAIGRANIGQSPPTWRDHTEGVFQFTDVVFPYVSKGVAVSLLHAPSRDGGDEQVRDNFLAASVDEIQVDSENGHEGKQHDAKTPVKTT